MSYLKELPTKMNIAFKRFPTTLIWVIFGCAYLIVLIETDSNLFREFYAETLVLILGVSWLIGIQFLNESFSNKLVTILLRFATIIGLFLYYCSLPDYENSTDITFTRWFVLLVAGHILIFFAPFIKYWNISDYWNYLQRVITAISRSALFSGIIYLGLSLALLAVENLFTVDIHEEIYLDLLIICLGIINTFIYLSDFPKDIYNTRQIRYSKALDVLIKYILIPIILLYLIIVYAYSLKILFSWELPEGWVSYLITILSISGFIIHIIIAPIRQKHENLIINKFYPFFYLSLFPLLILLFTAILTRIFEYNFTENRYFILLISFWIFGISLYILLSKKKQLSIVFISLFILALLSLFGPWSAFNVSIKAQSNELVNLIQKTKNEELSEKEIEQFINISRYLKDRRKLNVVDNALGFKTDYITSYYNAGNLILDSIYGVNKYSSIIEIGNNNYFYYKNSKDREIDIIGFEKIVELSLANQSKENNIIEVEDGYIKFSRFGQELFRYSIIDDLKNKINKYQNLNNVPTEEFEYYFNNENGDFKLIINSINGNKNNKEYEINSCKVLILMKLN
ncbi:DUF4153 domain-containing protein [Zunongwangia atlantica]|uniref:DUF4153 domain-containing protein n=1 Tax=Zunongwangia atlantica 22II14-10F7 TaxID=1185767 RepID=A0A1Y1T3I9_9FLAO|nr:DUF4153 domain-containing protein [Zunongwangia atlantica]ORL45154.1 hypothetical protein IIF7_11902 [Zunongwangia atlantica 22II14-10F7]